MKFEIDFFGHENIRSLHRRTIEITKEEYLTPNGDCIVGVGASTACADIPDELKQKLKEPKSKIKITIQTDSGQFEIRGIGDPHLILDHPTDIVIRKSGFICPRTLAINCDKASDSIPRTLVKSLQSSKSHGKFTIEVS